MAAKRKRDEHGKGLPPSLWLAALIVFVVLTLVWFVDKS